MYHPIPPRHLARMESPASSVPDADQAGVIPFRVRDGRPFVALITSRRSARWVIPKGLIDPGETAFEAARREAWEEAGLHGTVSERAVGRYRYGKWGREWTVAVHLMDVNFAADRWPESAVRARHWMTVAEAAACVSEAGLARLILDLPRLAGLTRPHDPGPGDPTAAR